MMGPNQEWVFVSYIHENEREVERLCKDLQSHGVSVWRDRDSIDPGSRWKTAIRTAIDKGAHFIACFSAEYVQRAENYMNEELTLAIDRLRTLSSDRNWFIPVKLNDCEIPDRDIGAGETLRALQWVELYGDWDRGVNRILQAIVPVDQPQSALSCFLYGDYAAQLMNLTLDARGVWQLVNEMRCLSGIPRPWIERYLIAFTCDHDIWRLLQSLSQTHKVGVVVDAALRLGVFYRSLQSALERRGKDISERDVALNLSQFRGALQALGTPNSVLEAFETIFAKIETASVEMEAKKLITAMNRVAGQQLLPWLERLISGDSIVTASREVGV